jgi:hypothetical protein
MCAAVNKNSYAYLIPVVLGVQLLLALLFIWQFSISPAIHFKPIAGKACLFVSLVLTLAGSVIVWRVRKPQILLEKKWTLLKAFAGMFVLCTLLSVTLFSLAILCSGGTRSSYTAHYEYSSGGSKSCSGIRVFDPELNKTIKICRPTWIGHRDEVRVVKVSNDLGIVVKEAVIL